MFLDFLFSIIVFVGLTFLVFLLIDFCCRKWLKEEKSYCSSEEEYYDRIRKRSKK